MLNQAENELLCRVGAGTAMGELLREYWVPALRSEALEADGAPARVRLMGENYVAFRASDGRVGFFDEGCPHRCASMALARNEDNALTCIFHGWKIDVSGKVVEVPSEPPERRAEFAAKVRVRHYPVREAGGVIWVYLGRQQPPHFYNWEWHALPSEHARPRRAVMHCNWFQGMEAVLDSAHVGFLHRAYQVKAGGELRFAGANPAPVFELEPKPYGFREAALRDLGDGTIYARIREVVLPLFAFIPSYPGGRLLMICSIPIDDEWNAQWYMFHHPEAPMTEEPRDLYKSSGDPDNFCSDMGSIDNLWHQDRARMKEGHWSGIKSFTYEDFICEEAMGPIVDRSREYLGSSDSIIIRVRRQVLGAAREFRQSGKLAFGHDDPSVDFSQVRGLAIRYPKGMDWRRISAFAVPPELVELTAPDIRTFLTMG